MARDRPRTQQAADDRSRTARARSGTRCSATRRLWCFRATRRSQFRRDCATPNRARDEPTAVDAAERSLVDERHLHERRRARLSGRAPLAIAGDAQHLLHRSDTEADFHLRDRPAAGACACPTTMMSVVVFVSTRSFSYLMLLFPGSPKCSGTRSTGGCSFDTSVEPSGHDVESALDRDEPDLGAISVTNPAAFGGKRRAVVDLPHGGADPSSAS